jgi:hypothetical protein
LQALIRSSEYHYNDQPYHNSLGTIKFNTIGVIFLGTLHRGSTKATLGKLTSNAAKALGASTRLLKVLETDSNILEQQRDSFDSVRQAIYCVPIRSIRNAIFRDGEF